MSSGRGGGVDMRRPLALVFYLLVVTYRFHMVWDRDGYSVLAQENTARALLVSQCKYHDNTAFIYIPICTKYKYLYIYVYIRIYVYQNSIICIYIYIYQYIKYPI